MGLWSEGKPTFVQPLDGEAGQAAPASALATASSSGEVLVGGDESKQLAMALAARDEAARVRWQLLTGLRLRHIQPRARPSQHDGRFRMPNRLTLAYVFTRTNSPAPHHTVP